MTELTDERLLSMAAEALGYASIDLERGAEEGPGSFRQALEVFPEELIAFARATLAAEPAFIASDPSDEDLADLVEVFNGDPLPAMRRALELWGRPTITALASEPPAPAIGPEWRPCVKLPITVHVRDQRPGEAHVSTREGITPVRPDDLIMRGVQGEEYPIGRDLFNRTYRLGAADPGDSAPAPAADGEHEELAQWLEDEAVYYEGLSTEASAKATRAAALLRQPAPATTHPTPTENDGTD